MEVLLLSVFATLTIILAFIHFKAKSKVFGLMLAFVLMVFGVYILYDGIEYKTGIVVNDTTLLVSNTYTNVKTSLPYVNNLIGMMVVVASIYLLFENGLGLFTKEVNK